MKSLAQQLSAMMSDKNVTSIHLVITDKAGNEWTIDRSVAERPVTVPKPKRKVTPKTKSKPEVVLDGESPDQTKTNQQIAKAYLIKQYGTASRGAKTVGISPTGITRESATGFFAQKVTTRLIKAGVPLHPVYSFKGELFDL